MVCLNLLKSAGISAGFYELVQDFLALPDKERKGTGMVAGCALSPLLGALYLTPLDGEMEQQKGIFYIRYMDDFVILAPTRHKLKSAIRTMYAVLADLKLSVHPDKKFIGTTHRGFDFLGYRFHAQKRLRPAEQTLNRLSERARRLYEQGSTPTVRSAMVSVAARRPQAARRNR